MKFCNIVFETELVNHKEIDFINYINKNTKYNDIKNNLPTLYVGWLFLKKCNIFDANILKNAIIENKLYWIPSPEENKTLYTIGINSFINLVPTIYLTNDYKYIDIDPVISQIFSLDDMINIIGINFDRSYQYKTDIIYLLKNNIIYGINLKMFEFFGFNISQILITINSGTTDVITDTNGDIYVEYFKKMPYFKYLKRFLVCTIENK